MENIEPVYKVSEINAEIKNILSRNFNNIWVEGEISGIKRSSLNHIYFDLKDENSIISCVLFKWNVKDIDFDLQNGLLIKVLADLSIYEKQSKYQLIIKKIVPLKLGPLQIAFEKLKKKLEEEGLFDEKRKKKIPKFPQNVGVITSLHGAAVRDIISIIKRRAPNINIIIYPVKVQGEGAKEEIASAINDINEKLSWVDVLLVGRGGGSMEDLWAFNEEIVARAIANSRIPIISCVGHQTDFTISDFVADLRAPTPSAAAEIVAQNIEDVLSSIKQTEKRLIQSLKLIYHKIYSKFLIFVKSRFFLSPFSIIEKFVVSLDDLHTKIIDEMDRKILIISNKLENLKGRLNNLNPNIPAKKGYIISRKGERIIKSIKEVEPGDKLELIFYDGYAKTLVNEKKLMEEK
ncbi:MAG: exodeoxyribonuclease VII large subunit [Elusimicrobiota bacterium]